MRGFFFLYFVIVSDKYMIASWLPLKISLQRQSKSSRVSIHWQRITTTLASSILWVFLLLLVVFLRSKSHLVDHLIVSASWRHISWRWNVIIGRVKGAMGSQWEWNIKIQNLASWASSVTRRVLVARLMTILVGDHNRLRLAAAEDNIRHRRCKLSRKHTHIPHWPSK